MNTRFDRVKPAVVGLLVCAFLLGALEITARVLSTIRDDLRQHAATWFIYSPDDREIAVHNGGTGGFRSYVGYDPKQRIGVVVLSNASTVIGVDDIGIHLLNPKAPLADPELPKEHTEIHIDPKLLDNYIGRYQVTPHLVLEITRDEDRLFAQGFAQLPQNPPGDPTDLPKFELFAEGERRFFARVSEQQIIFDTGPDGRATGLIVHKAGRDMAGIRLF